MPSPAFDALVQQLKQLPGLGFRSAERLALHLLVEKPDRLPALVEALETAADKLRACPVTGNLTDGEVCPLYADPDRDRSVVCVVEQVPDLMALEKSGAFQGTYHVLQGKLSPIHNVGPEDLTLEALGNRIESGEAKELILALGNDIEGEATCHYIRQELVGDRPVSVSRIGFGLPSGGNLVYADPVTLRSALEGRRPVQ
ncbi:MAG: recombination mediator RecR [Opitutales bacterium]